MFLTTAAKFYTTTLGSAVWQNPVPSWNLTVIYSGYEKLILPSISFQEWFMASECFKILGRFMIKLSLAWAMIVMTGVSRLSGASRSFFIHLLIHFWWCTLNTECNFVTQKNIPSINHQDFSPDFSLQGSKQRFLLHVDCDLPSFNTALKIHQTQTTWVTCFPLSAQRPSASPDAVVWACLSLFFSLHIHLSLPNAGFHSHDSRIPWCDVTLIGANGCMRIPPSHLYCKWQNCGCSREKVWAWIWPLNITLKLWTCQLYKFKYKVCYERSQIHDWNMWAADCQLVQHFKWASKI